jgi:hypothetical protein
MISFTASLKPRNRSRVEEISLESPVMNLKCLTNLVMKTIALVLASPRPGVPRLSSDSVLQGVVMLIFFQATAAFAGSATWKATPASENWFTASNWTPGTVPNGPADTATFASSNQRSPFIGFDTELNGIVFNPRASAFTIVNAPLTSPTLTISGAGITNNSGIVQNVAFQFGSAQIVFLNSATAGSLTAFTTTNITFGGTSSAGNAKFTNNGLMNFTGTSTASGATITNNAELIFDQSSMAGNGIFTNNGAGGFAGFIGFEDTSTGGNGTFTNTGGKVSGDDGGLIVVNGGTAGNATFTNNGGAVSGALGGRTLFNDTGAAGSATLIANAGSGGGPGGLIHFLNTSTGGRARVQVFGNGKLDISGHAAPGMTIGSVEGNGHVFLGSRRLTVGSNNLNTNFVGSIQDGGANDGIGGSLTKTGTGELVLGRRNTYTGGTIIRRGHLTVNNQVGSGTGTGLVQVNGGFLSGKGIITGAVNIGNGVSAGAVLLPGTAGTPGNLTINNSLTFNPLSTYECVLVRTTPAVGKVNALGVIIHSGVTFEFVDRTTGILTRGAVFTAINNISANPIGGTFANLADGTTFSSGGNTFKANYHGGTGNDLILTVQ